MTSKAGVVDNVRFFSNGIELLKPLIETISTHQQKPPHIQVLTPAATLVCLCDALDMDAVTVVNQIRRARSDMDSAFHNEWQAMVEYARGELL